MVGPNLDRLHEVRVSAGPEPTELHNPMPEHPPVPDLRAGIEQGGAANRHAANAGKGKLFARERVRLLVDDGSFVEDGVFANCPPTAS